MKKNIIRKRFIALFLGVMLLLAGSMPSGAATHLELIQSRINTIEDVDGPTLQELIIYMADNFKDTKMSSWYAKNVAKLIGINGINGYPDGTFKPGGTITRAEFTKILISTLYGDQKSDCNSHWACGFITKAEDVGILKAGEIHMDNINGAITRQEMAKMISLAAKVKLGEKDATNKAEVGYGVKDLSKINENYKNFVLDAYAKGIITGYPDGTFGAEKTATRAEASTMVVRLLDEKTREKSNLGYNTVESLGLKEEHRDKYGQAFYGNYESKLNPLNHVVFIKKSDLPLVIDGDFVLEDIKLSADKNNILVTRTLLTSKPVNFGISLSIKNSNRTTRNSIEFFEKDLGNNRYQTTHELDTGWEGVNERISIDDVLYISFSDMTAKRHIAIEKGEIFK